MRKSQLEELSQLAFQSPIVNACLRRAREMRLDPTGDDAAEFLLYVVGRLVAQNESLIRGAIEREQRGPSPFEKMYQQFAVAKSLLGEISGCNYAAAIADSGRPSVEARYLGGKPPAKSEAEASDEDGPIIVEDKS